MQNRSAARSPTTRLEVLSGRTGPDLDGWLAEVAMRGETEDWRAWARSRAALR